MEKTRLKRRLPTKPKREEPKYKAATPVKAKEPEPQRREVDPAQLAAFQQLDSGLRGDLARARALCDSGEALRVTGKGSRSGVDLLSLFGDVEHEECRARLRRVTDGLHDLENELLRFWADVSFDLDCLRRFGHVMRIQSESADRLVERRAELVQRMDLRLVGVQSLMENVRVSRGMDKDQRSGVKRIAMQELGAYAEGNW